MDLDVLCLRLGGVRFSALLPSGPLELGIGEVLVQLEVGVFVGIALSKELRELLICLLLLCTMSLGFCELPGKATLVLTPSLHLLDLAFQKWGECLLHLRWEIEWIESLLDHVRVVDVGCSDIKSGRAVGLRIDALESFVEDLILRVSPGRQGLTSSLAGFPVLHAEGQVFRKVEELVAICISRREYGLEFGGCPFCSSAFSLPMSFLLRLYLLW